jgi:hypothetical protein
VELRLEGYEHYAHDVTADVDQRIHWVLQPIPARVAPERRVRTHRRSTPRRERRSGGHDGFYVFD